jgi:hypothetical protein
MGSEFFKGFWGYVSTLDWWQGLVVIFIVIFAFAVGKFWRNVLTWIGERITGNTKLTTTLQYRVFWGLSNDALNIQMKDEIRRSIKENGFYELNSNDYTQYVKNQTKVLISIFRKHIINLYPPDENRIIISMADVLQYIDEKEGIFEDVFLEIYNEAKKIKNQDDEYINDIDDKFEKEIIEYTTSQNKEVDCKVCFSILFGKREIANNKKSRIKSLKAQMNFAEQKLATLHSNFLSFYSDKLNKKQEK